MIKTYSNCYFQPEQILTIFWGANSHYPNLRKARIDG